MAKVIYTYNNQILKSTDNEWYTEPTPPIILDEVTIGTQTWMSKNLAIDDGGSGIYHADLTNVNGYNLGTQYYYTWDAAVRIANSIQGWRLPSINDYNTLSSYLGQTPEIRLPKYKATYAWGNYNGTDDYGFTALPVGYITNNELIEVKYCINLWTTTATSTGSNILYFYIGTSNLAYSFADKNNGLSVRLIKV